MLGLCQPVIDVVLGAGIFEGVRPNELSSLQGGLDVRRRRARIAWRGEVGSVVGENGMDLVRDGGDQVGCRKSPAVRRATFSCISTKANFDVRSMATSR
jgi:hypothetical protein